MILSEQSVILVPLLITDMLYPVISVPGRVNGGLHEILIESVVVVVYDKPYTEDNGPEMRAV